MFRGYLSKYFKVELTSYLYKINKKKVDKIEIKKECRKKRINAFFIDKQTTRKSKSNKHTHRFQILDCLHHLQKPFFTIISSETKNS